MATASGEHPQVGVYLNAAQAYKLDYYLDYTTSVESTRCVRGRQHLTVTVNLRSLVPRTFRQLSHYVAPRSELFGRGSIVDTISFFAPVGGSSRTLAVDGDDQNLEKQTLEGREVVTQSVRLVPGQARLVTVEMVSGRGQSGDAELRVTPGVRSAGIGPVGPSAC